MNRKFLVAFEVDSILLRGFQYSWQEIWKYLGYNDAIRQQGMHKYLVGEFTYTQWCDYCLGHFVARGLTKDNFAQITAPFQVVHNLHKGIGMLKAKGAVVAAISGGVDAFLEAMIPDYQEMFDHTFINLNSSVAFCKISVNSALARDYA